MLYSKRSCAERTGSSVNPGEAGLPLCKFSSLLPRCTKRFVCGNQYSVPYRLASSGPMRPVRLHADFGCRISRAGYNSHQFIQNGGTQWLARSSFINHHTGGVVYEDIEARAFREGAESEQYHSQSAQGARVATPEWKRSFHDGIYF